MASRVRLGLIVGAVALIFFRFAWPYVGVPWPVAAWLATQRGEPSQIEPRRGEGRLPVCQRGRVNFTTFAGLVVRYEREVCGENR